MVGEEKKKGEATKISKMQTLYLILIVLKEEKSFYTIVQNSKRWNVKKLKFFKCYVKTAT